MSSSDVTVHPRYAVGTCADRVAREGSSRRRAGTSGPESEANSAGATTTAEDLRVAGESRTGDRTDPLISCSLSGARRLLHSWRRVI